MMMMQGIKGGQQVCAWFSEVGVKLTFCTRPMPNVLSSAEDDSIDTIKV